MSNRRSEAYLRATVLAMAVSLFVSLTPACAQDAEKGAKAVASNEGEEPEEPVEPSSLIGETPAQALDLLVFSGQSLGLKSMSRIGKSMRTLYPSVKLANTGVQADNMVSKSKSALHIAGNIGLSFVGDAVGDATFAWASTVLAGVSGGGVAAVGLGFFAKGAFNMENVGVAANTLNKVADSVADSVGPAIVNFQNDIYRRQNTINFFFDGNKILFDDIDER